MASNRNNHNSRAADGSGSSSRRPALPDLNVTPKYFTGDIPNPSTPSTLGSTGSSQNSTIITRKRGLGSIIEENPQATEARRVWNTKSVVYQNNVHRPQIQISRLVQLRPMIFSVRGIFPFSQVGNPSLISNQQASNVVTGPIQVPVARKIERIVWPCVLFTPHLKLAMVRAGPGNAPSKFPVAVCNNHGNLGFLKFETIDNTSKEYVLVIHHNPADPTLVHLFNHCLLSFPPAQPKYTLEQLTLPFKLAPENKFMKKCMLCDKSLQGKDVYIYGGDKSYCSEECREVVIKADMEKEEKEEAERIAAEIDKEMMAIAASRSRQADKKKGKMEEGSSSSTNNAASKGKQTIFFIDDD